MIYPLLPRFLSTTLGAGAAWVGAIEGAAESLSAVLKTLAGRWSDRAGARRRFVLLGYLIAGAARPLVAAAWLPVHVLAVRLTDRVGKGIRTAPRDALLADSTPVAERGRAFGFHRAADHFGAVVGPLIAFALLALGLELRTVFWWAALPAALAVLAVWLLVRDVTPAGPAAPSVPRDRTAPAPPAPLAPRFRRYVAIVALFTLGNSTDAFLLLRAGDLGVAAVWIPVIWAVHNAVKSASSTCGGTLSDRFGRRPLIVTGWALYALVYLGFAFASAPWHAWALFGLYGLFYGATEGPEKAFVADLVPAERRGAAFGWFHGAVGLTALPASIVFGALWDAFGPTTAFAFGAAVAALAAVLLTACVRPAVR